MKKSTVLAIFTAIFCLLLAGAASAKEIKLGVAWMGKSGMANRVFSGLEKGLKDLAPGAKIEVNKELAGKEELSELTARYQKEKDGMVILRSNGAKFLGKNPPAIPAFIGACNQPVLLGALKNMDAPEGKVTGVTYFLPAKTQLEAVQAILPDVKSVLLLTEKGHPSSDIDSAGTKKACGELGLSFSEKRSADKAEVIQAVKAASGKVSAMIIGNQAMIIDNTKAIVAAAGNTPVFSYSSKPVKAGALGGYVADDVKLGRMLAQSVVEVLISGKAVKDVPVKTDPKPKFFVNAKTAQRIKVEVPYSILEAATVIE